MTSQYCEAIHFTKTAENLNCILKKYVTNILYPLVVNTTLTDDMTDILLQKPQNVWSPLSNYTYNDILKFWYRIVTDPKADIPTADDACKADGAYLMLIIHQTDYDFVINILDQQVEKRMYLQGTRPTESEGYVDELGRPLTFIKWDSAGINGPGLYLRTNSGRNMETSYGSNEYYYICQVQLN